MVFEELTESVTTYPLTHEGIAFMRPPSASCIEEGDTELGEGSALGFAVIKIRKKLLGPLEMDTVLETWRAPALNCYSLYDRFQLRRPHQSRIITTNIHEVKSVKLGEPSSKLFETQTTFVERSPSQVAEEFNRRYPEDSKRCSTCDGTKVQDQAYYATRAR